MGAIGREELMQGWDRMQQPQDSPAVGGEERILVSVRLRPLNETELGRNDVCDWECIDDHTIMFRNSLPERALFPTAHTFDRVFRSDSTTRQVYEEAAKQVALSVVSGINSSVFAYGQTSSGKTYTMTGITEYTISDIFDYIQRHQERAFVLKFSAIEIYNEAVKDLISSDGAQLRLLDDPDKGTVVEKLTEETLRDWNHMKELLSICEAQRQIGETSLNEASSRSHQILRLIVESSAREFLGKDNSNTLSATVNFVDLAGSERASQALSAGARLKEGCHINRSLLTLGTVIRKLSKGRNGHIPYRDSKLTRILQSSLGGNARTAIICTMSPARIHLEQSRNTLLFASCAKQVATNARVNIVMSDKALVKHLQKELARLESELRSPGSAPSLSNRSNFLLREKDAKIQKLEKEVKELSEQRDLAQSRLDDLLRVSGDSQSTKLWSGFRDPPFHVSNQYDDELSLSESSGVIDQSLDFGLEYISSSNADENYLYLPQVPNKRYESTFQTNGHEFTEASPLEAVAEVSRGDSEIDFVEPFRDVGSGDIEESTKCRNDNCIVGLPGDVEESQESMQANDTNEIIEPVYEPNTKLDRDVDNLEQGSIVDVDGVVRERELESSNGADIQLKLVEEGVTVNTWGQFQEIKTPVRNVVELLPCEPLPWTRPPLRKTRSCNATLANNTSPFWFEQSEQNENTPPSQVVKGFPPIPKAFRWRPYSLNHRSETGRSPRAESYASEQIASPDTPNSQNEIPEENIASIHSFMKDLQNMAQRTYDEQVTNGQENDQNEVVTKGHKILRDVGLDPMQISMESPTHWCMEFERQQKEIVMLWHECNVSLIHRTYFFLLFKGDPSDKIYMEVELRRLSFLKSSFTRANLTTSDGRIITSTSSLRTLRREREMLSRQMGKRLKVEEREDLFKQWGIGLKSKQRKLHLARCLWSDPRNMEHNRNSAALVAKLVGLLEPGQGLKEMFGLSFSPHTPRRKSYSFGWKNGVSPL